MIAPTRPLTAELGGAPGLIEARDEGRWPLLPEPVPDDQLSLWNFYYLNTCPPPRDPTMVWGTDVDCGELQAYLKRVNATGDVLVTPAHVLVAAVATALARHPQFNRRVLRRRVMNYRDVNVVVPFQKKTTVGIDVTLFEKADRKSVTEIAAEAWRTAQAAARGGSGVKEPIYMRFPRRLQALAHPFHVWLVNTLNMPVRETNKRQRTASALVNYFGAKGMPPMRSYKPSRMPYDVAMTSVTMGAIEPRPAAVNGQVVVRPVAPLFVRADHRLVDAYEVGQFTETIRKLLADPAALDAAEPPTEGRDEVGRDEQSRDRQGAVRDNIDPALTAL